MSLGRIAYLEGNRLGGCSEDKHNNLKYNGLPSISLKAPHVGQWKGTKMTPSPLNGLGSSFI